MRILYGTNNPAKLALMQRWLVGLQVELVGLSAVPGHPPDIDESGDTPLENAALKAAGYCRFSGMPTLAADTGLYLDGLRPEEQPGVHARRVGGARLSDEAMMAHYAGIARKHGGRVMARYRNALCLIHPDGRQFSRFDDSVSSAPFYLVETPHAKRVPGFPLDALSVDIETGQYYYDMESTRADSDLAQGEGYRRFLQDALERFA